MPLKVLATNVYLAGHNDLRSSIRWPASLRSERVRTRLKMSLVWMPAKQLALLRLGSLLAPWANRRKVPAPTGDNDSAARALFRFCLMLPWVILQSSCHEIGVVKPGDKIQLMNGTRPLMWQKLVFYTKAVGRNFLTSGDVSYIAYQDCSGYSCGWYCYLGNQSCDRAITWCLTRWIWFCKVSTQLGQTSIIDLREALEKLRLRRPITSKSSGLNWNISRHLIWYRCGFPWTSSYGCYQERLKRREFNIDTYHDSSVCYL